MGKKYIFEGKVKILPSLNQKDTYVEQMPDKFQKAVVRSHCFAGKMVYRMKSDLDLEEYRNLAIDFFASNHINLPKGALLVTQDQSKIVHIPAIELNEKTLYSCQITNIDVVVDGFKRFWQRPSVKKRIGKSKQFTYSLLPFDPENLLEFLEHIILYFIENMRSADIIYIVFSMQGNPGFCAKLLFNPEVL